MYFKQKSNNCKVENLLEKGTWDEWKNWSVLLNFVRMSEDDGGAGWRDSEVRTVREIRMTVWDFLAATCDKHSYNGLMLEDEYFQRPLYFFVFLTESTNVICTSIYSYLS
jgi:hypothetical protein